MAVADPYQPTRDDHFYVRPVDRGQPRARPVRRLGAPGPGGTAHRGAARGVGRLGRQLPRQRPDPLRCSRRRSATASWPSSSGPWTPTGWWCRWPPPTCSPTPFSATARLPATTRACGPSPCRRRCAIMDLGAELGAKIYVFWGGREGVGDQRRQGPARRAQAAARGAQLPGGVLDRPGLRLHLRPGAEAQRAARRHLPAHGRPRAGLHRPRLTTPRWWASTRRWRTSGWPGWTSCMAWRQALDAGKLVHIDLNDQMPGRFDQDLRFGQGDLRNAFFLVKLLEDAGYSGPKHYDAHALRTEDEDGVWAFAAGCMRTYKIMQEKARRFNADPEIQGYPARDRRARRGRAATPDRLQPPGRRRAEGRQLRCRRDRRQGPRLRAAGPAHHRGAAGGAVGGRR